MAVVLIVGILLLTFGSGADPARGDTAGTKEPASAIAFVPDPVQDPIGEIASRDPAPIDNGFRIVDETGRAIPAASASLTRHDDLAPEFPDSWPWADISMWSLATEVVEADQDGRVRFHDSGLGERSLWVTAIGYAPWSKRFSANDRIEAPDGTVVLLHTPSLAVKVVDLRGDPVVGARVVQRLSLNDATRAELGPSRTELAMALVRTELTDRNGRIELADLGGRQVLDATQGESRSGPWYGMPPAAPELRLRDCFTWSGRLIGPGLPVETSDSRVLLNSIEGGRVVRIGTVPVRSNGTFGPTNSPRTAGEHFEFELDGEQWIPMTVVRVIAEDERHVDVEIRAKSGVHFPVQVAEHDGAAISGARVDWAWNLGAMTQWASRFSNAEGIADFRAAPLGPLVLSIEAAGHVPFRADLNVTSDVTPPYRVELARGGKVVGRVLAQGRPLENFSIVYRGSDSVANFGVADFVDRKDGSFEIDGMPLGELSMFAVGEDLPRSEDQRVGVAVGLARSVVFDLSPGIVGRVFVHDAMTGEPIVDAIAQVWTSEGRVRIREHGQPSRSDSSGRIEVPGLAGSDVSVIEIRADGYALSEMSVAPSAKGTVDLGIVALVRPRSLVVRLIVPSDSSPTSWTCAIDSGGINEWRPFPASGELRFDALPVAGHTVTIAHGAEHTESRFVTVGPDADSSIVFDVASGARFFVEVGDGAGEVAPQGSWLVVSTYSHGYRVVRKCIRSVPRDGAVEITGVQEPRVLIECIDSAGSSLASSSRATRDIDGGRVRLSLKSNPVSLLLVDRDENALPDLAVRIGSPDSGWAGSGTTDSRGMATLPCTSRTIDVIVQRQPNGGGVVRGVRVGDEPVRIVADLRAVLGVRLLDGTEPVGGASIWIEDADLGAVFPSLVTDDKGEARGVGYFEQSFRGIVRTPGIWPVEFHVDAHTPERLQEFQVRRRGSVVLHAKRAGLPLRSTAIAVSSLEYSEPLSEWIARGAITTSSASLTTDDQGDLRIDGVPRGPYRWSVAVEDGIQVGGRFDVLPSRRVDVDLSVP